MGDPEDDEEEEEEKKKSEEDEDDEEDNGEEEEETWQVMRYGSLQRNIPLPYHFRVASDLALQVRAELFRRAADGDDGVALE
jgi:HSP20 family molecular chaperone IbpA